MLNGEVRWADATFDGMELELVKVNLDTCLDDPDLVAVERFSQSYPETAQLIRRYDDRIHGLNNTARELVNELQEPVTEFRRNTEGITEDDHDELMSLLLGVYDGTHDEDFPDWWVESRADAVIAVTEVVPELEQWYDEQEQFLDFSGEVQESLLTAKQEIQAEYGIDLESELE